MLKRLDLMDAKEQWANEPAQRRPWQFGEKGHYLVMPPSSSADFRLSNTVPAQLFGVKHVARGCMLFQTERDTGLLFHPSWNQGGCFPILIKSSVSAKLTSNPFPSPAFQGFWWQTWHATSYRSKSKLNTKESPVPCGNTGQDYFWTETA